MPRSRGKQGSTAMTYRTRGRAFSAVGVLVFLALSAFALGCGDDGDDAASQASDAVEHRPHFLFSQTASNGTFVPVAGESGTFILTLRGVSPSTTYFSDRPERIAGSLPTSGFIADGNVFDAEDPPNAAVVLEEPEAEKKDTVVAELSDPSYDEGAGTLTYRAKVLGAGQGDLEHWSPHLDEALPRSFDATSVFIDTALLYQLVFFIKDNKGNPIPNVTVKYAPGGTADYTSATSDANGEINYLSLYTEQNDNGAINFYTIFPGKVCNYAKPEFTEQTGNSSLVAVWRAYDSQNDPIPSVTLRLDRVNYPWGVETGSDGTKLFGFPAPADTSNMRLLANLTLPGTVC